MSPSNHHRSSGWLIRSQRNHHHVSLFEGFAKAAHSNDFWELLLHLVNKSKHVIVEYVIVVRAHDQLFNESLVEVSIV